MDVTDESLNTLVSRKEATIIDLANRDPAKISSKTWMNDVARQIRNALKTQGLVFFINHGISQQRINDVYNVMDTFCSLPDDVKDLYKANYTGSFQGYVPSGSETLNYSGEREIKYCYNINSLSGTFPTKEVTHFREAVKDLVEDYVILSNLILRLTAEALEIDPDVLTSLHKGMMKEANHTTFRIIYYPPLEDNISSDVTRCGEHTDWGTFTLLSQDREGGLEVLMNEEWRRVGFLPGAILMVIGDILDEWTSSKYKSTKHRVVVPRSNTVRKKGRHSSVFFVQPDDHTVVDRLFFNQCKIGEKHDSETTEGCVKRLSALEYLQQKYKEAGRD